jgi:hypothetical protein
MRGWKPRGHSPIGNEASPRGTGLFQVAPIGAGLWRLSRIQHIPSEVSFLLLFSGILHSGCFFG